MSTATPQAAAGKPLPPTEFSNAMHNIERPVDVATWRRTPEWQIYIAGYNACVAAANARIMSLYDLPKATKRCFPADAEG